MADRWESRAEPSVGQGKLYWHILLGRYPQAEALTSAAHKKLNNRPGLHFTPLRWLHITTLVVGLAEDFSATEISQVVTSAHSLLSKIPPTNLRLERVLYHPEAIAIGIRPHGVLDDVQKSVQQATNSVVSSERILNDQAWNPHCTIAYSTAVQPAHPIIAALGHDLPVCNVTVDAIDLVCQRGPERLWDWHSLATIPFKG